jgi:hypothetical protein
MIYSRSSSPRRFTALANVKERCHDVVPVEGGRPVNSYLWEDYPAGVAGVEAQREADRLNYDELQRAA